MCQDVTMFTTFPIKLKLFHSKISCYIKFPSVPVPNTVHRLSRMTSHPRSFPSIPNAQQGNQGPEEQLHVTGGLWRAQLWDSSIIWQSQKYFCISLRGHHEKREHPIPLQVMECYLTESVFQTGDCKHTAGLFYSTSSRFCRGWWWLWEVCVHTAQSTASIPEQAQPEKQC